MDVKTNLAGQVVRRGEIGAARIGRGEKNSRGLLGFWSL